MKRSTNKSFLYRNGLTICFLVLTFITIIGQAVTGWKTHNEDLQDLGGKSISFIPYLSSGHFVEAIFENWESEFLQMGMYVLLTIWLKQDGSSESKKIDGDEDVDREPKPHVQAPWPVNKGGWILKVYKNSLSTAFFLLFLISFFLHAAGSYKNSNLENRLKHKPQQAYSEYLMSSQFWFESLQNWQSEFLSVASIVFLSIYLRQKGSPESKPVDAPHLETGNN